jgi:osmoprotectant transport system substrate-binding protein
MSRGRLRFMLPLAALSLIAAGCAGDDGSDSDATADAAGDTDAAAPEGPTINVRGQAFSESVTIAEVYGQYLDAKGYDVEILTEAGFRAEAVTGIETGELDLIIDYIGSAQAELVPDAEASADPDEVSATLAPFYETIDATLLEYSPAVDGNAYVVRGDEDAVTISDTADSGLVLGASAQCFERPQCYVGLTDPEIYGIEYADTVTLEFGPLLGDALAEGEVDAVVWNTTAPQIETEGFKVLEDDQGLFSADNIAPIVRTEVLDAYGEMLADDLNELSAQITTEDLLEWNVQTDIELRESDDVATEWLEAEGLL